MKEMIRMAFTRERYEATFLVDNDEAEILINELPTDWKIDPNGTKVVLAEFSRLLAAMLYKDGRFFDDTKSTSVRELIEWILTKGGD